MVLDLYLLHLRNYQVEYLFFFVQLSDEMFLKNKFKLEDEVFISWDNKRESLLE